jgi:hypothetical protein
MKMIEKIEMEVIANIMMLMIKGSMRIPHDHDDVGILCG